MRATSQGLGVLIPEAIVGDVLTGLVVPEADDFGSSGGSQRPLRPAPTDSSNLIEEAA